MNKTTEKKVRRALADLGIETRRGAAWLYYPDDSMIVEVWRGKPTQTWLWSMMHEVGHHMLQSKRDYNRRFWRTAQTKAYVVDRVSAVQLMKEEILAWEEGLKWAKAIGVEVDQKSYDKYASRFLMRYMESIPGAIKKNAWLRSFFS
jgi:hypothetical protein